MKKIFALLLAVTMIFGAAFALDGLTVGAEFRINDFDAEEMAEVMGLRLYLNYEAAMMDDALELEAELGFQMSNFDDMVNDLDLMLEGRFFLDISPAARLGFILNSETTIPLDGEIGSWLTPGVKWQQGFGFGNIFLQVDVPFILVDESMDPLDIVELDFTLSILNERDDRNGFGGEIVLENILSDPDDSDFVQELYVTPFYGQGNWYAEVEVGLPLVENGMDFFGMTITPKFEMDITAVDGLSFWLDVPVSRIGAEFGDPVIGVGFGIDFKF